MTTRNIIDKALEQERASSACAQLGAAFFFCARPQAALAPDLLISAGSFRAAKRRAWFSSPRPRTTAPAPADEGLRLQQLTAD
jgi:hypothetical protein